MSDITVNSDHHDQNKETMIGLIETLLALIIGDERAAEFLDLAGVSVITSVLDANIIIQDVSRFLKTKRPTSLLIAARLGGVRFFATVSVREEVSRHLGRVAGRHGTPIDEARQVWNEEYAPLITFLDPAELPPLSERALSVSQLDRDDVPTAKVVDLIRSHTFLSEDHHLAAYKPTGRNWTELTVAFRDKSQRDVSFIGIHLGGGIAIWIGISTIRTLVSLLKVMNKRVVFGAALILLIAAGIVFLCPALRNWFGERLRMVLDSEWGQVLDQLTKIVNQLVLIDEQAKRANAFIAEKQIVHEAPEKVIDHVIMALSQTHAPLTVREITRRIKVQGYKPRGRHPEQYVSRVLRQNQHLFVRGQPSNRWTLKSYAFIS